MTYYSINKILEIIKNYRVNMNNIRNQNNDLSSVGVSVYGVEASLPKGNGTSDIVATEAFRLIEGTKHFANIKTDMKYLQDRWHRVTDEKQAMVLSLSLDGLSVEEIANIQEVSRSSVYRTLTNIAEVIKGYQH